MDLWVEKFSKLQATAGTDTWDVLYLICRGLDKANIPLPGSNEKTETSDEENK